MLPEIPDGYPQLLDALKARIREARVRAASSVNSELIALYWQIGQEILLRQREAGWGAKVADRLSGDLRIAFPNMKGFSKSNLMYMRKLASAWPAGTIFPQLVGKLAWGHNRLLLDKVGDPAERCWYLQAAIEHGWSRDVLLHQIESGLCHRQGKAITNFERALPPLQSELALGLLKDPYNLEFLDMGNDFRERELHRGLVRHMRDFLLELGSGFAFVGDEYHLDVGGADFYIDLLFYHVRLHCYVIIELKTGEFRPEHAGKLGFYLAAVDDLLRLPPDGPSIGLVLCREKNRIVAEYALREISAPMSVSGITLKKNLPDDLRASLPTVDEIESRLRES